MDAVSSITQKGQVTIPAFIRKSTGLTAGKKALFIKEKDRVYIKPAVDFLSLEGSIKSKKPFVIGLQTEAAQAFVAKRHAKSR